MSDFPLGIGVSVSKNHDILWLVRGRPFVLSTVHDNAPNNARIHDTHAAFFWLDYRLSDTGIDILCCRAPIFVLSDDVSFILGI